MVRTLRNEFKLQSEAPADEEYLSTQWHLSLHKLMDGFCSSARRGKSSSSVRDISGEGLEIVFAAASCERRLISTLQD